MYEKLQSILEAQRELKDQLNDENFWLSEATKCGLTTKFDSVKVYVHLREYGPEISIFVNKKVITTFEHDKLVGSAKYTAYNDNWEINNF